MKIAVQPAGAPMLAEPDSGKKRRLHLLRAGRRLGACLGLALAALSCETMNPETSIQLFASESVITADTEILAFGARVTEDRIPVTDAEVVFRCELIVDGVTMTMPEAPPQLTNENGLTGIGLDVAKVRDALRDDADAWSALHTMATVRGMSANDSLTVPVESGDPGSSSGSERIRPLGTSIRSLHGAWQVDEVNPVGQPSDVGRR